MADDQTPGPAADAAGETAVGAAAAAPPSPPAIVVHGDASAEEVAALVAVLSAASGGGEPASEEPVSTWAAHGSAMRHPVNHGPGAWRTSLRP